MDSNYTLHIRLKKSGAAHDISVHRASRLGEVARVMIREGHIVTGYTCHKTWDGRDWVFMNGTRHFGKG